ncbi:MAG: HD domain-containing protein [Cyanobacteriota bacterium]
MANFTETPVLGDRYVYALQFVAIAHLNQVRKDGTPYLAHLLSVSALVLEAGGSEDEAIAALLHDYAEDIASSPKEGLETIEREFGAAVAAIFSRAPAMEFS